MGLPKAYVFKSLIMLINVKLIKMAWLQITQILISFSNRIIQFNKCINKDIKCTFFGMHY